MSLLLSMLIVSPSVEHKYRTGPFGSDIKQTLSALAYFNKAQ